MYVVQCDLTNVSTCGTSTTMKIQNISSIPQSSLCSHPLLAQATTDSVTIVLPFLECHVNGITKYVTFCAWLLLNMFLKFIYNVVCIGRLFILWLHSIPLYGHTTICLSKFLLIDLGACFDLGLFTNKTVINIYNKSFC